LTYQRVEDKRPKEGKDLELICSFSIWSLLALAVIFVPPTNANRSII
jgi:hypothetical protein